MLIENGDLTKTNLPRRQILLKVSWTLEVFEDGLPGGRSEKVVFGGSAPTIYVQYGEWVYVLVYL